MAVAVTEGWSQNLVWVAKGVAQQRLLGQVGLARQGWVEFLGRARVYRDPAAQLLRRTAEGWRLQRCPLSGKPSCKSIRGSAGGPEPLGR